MINKLKSTAVAFAIAGFVVAGVGAVSAMSVDFKIGQELGKDEAAITAMLTSAGYTDIEVETEDGELEVEATKDGMEVEFELSMKNGQIVAIEIEEADDEEDDD